jgi:hypothetical protein
MGKEMKLLANIFFCLHHPPDTEKEPAAENPSLYPAAALSLFFLS